MHGILILICNGEGFQEYRHSVIIEARIEIVVYSTITHRCLETEAETMTETWFESYKRGFRNGGEMTEKYTREKETLSWVRNT